MPMPSKFTAKRRQLVLAALAAGASRRTAAELAGLHHSTITVWLRRGEKASEGSRYCVFRDQVLRAEADSHRPRLLPVDEPSPVDVRHAWDFLIEQDEFGTAPSGPVEFSVSFSDGTPLN